MGFECFTPKAKELFNRKDFAYSPLSALARERKVIEVICKTDSIGLFVPDWDAAWAEARKRFKKTGELLPKYMYRPGLPIRMWHDFASTDNPYYERDFLHVLLNQLAETYIEPMKMASIYEFGCGTGHNLHTLHEALGSKFWFGGRDKSEEACHLVIESGFPCEPFDMTQADTNGCQEIAPGAVFLTVGSMEQIGINWSKFYDYLLHQQPALVIHIEPFLEMYDQDLLLDFLAARYHQKRGYLQGYLPHLEYQASLKRIEIVASQRVRFGSFYNEGYNYVIWRGR